MYKNTTQYVQSFSYTMSLGFVVRGHHTSLAIFTHEKCEIELIADDADFFNVTLFVFGEKGGIKLKNITEIHVNYRPGMIAFESDIDMTGQTMKLDRILSIMAVSVRA